VGGGQRGRRRTHRRLRRLGRARNAAPPPVSVRHARARATVAVITVPTAVAAPARDGAGAATAVGTSRAVGLGNVKTPRRLRVVSVGTRGPGRFPAGVPPGWPITTLRAVGQALPLAPRRHASTRIKLNPVGSQLVYCSHCAHT